MTYENPVKDITTERIAELLKQRSITQMQYAEVLNVSQPVVSDKLAGKIVFTSKDIKKTAISLGVTTDYLFGLTDDANVIGKESYL
ncbi:helix-turn-helix domain-containing protein [Bifidobacterium pseudocatenulatum]|mgnify:FL=1|uniref:XRE family transcriptional regulator n=1 Tax=Bifidobacterium pseudocatenulatum TaxID=28026 RepID=A0A3E5HMC0_BIFPS|nr:helix-turn-helix transcriptional regulator [Bifidobacterium pseudocatenulatum]RGP02624.1 XRE family transcriptional regulator [Bifidobacterium pseudocatenulatum]